MIWWPEIGIGYYPVKPGTEPYDQAYFDRYAEYTNNPMTAHLNAARVEFVRGHKGWLLDIGIGSGTFIEAYDKAAGDEAEALGYDVNPAGLKWLMERNKAHDPYANSASSVTMWDVIEHIQDIPRLLTSIHNDLYISTPIYRDMEHVLASKHFRKDEHCWYFTERGLVHMMDACGFDLVSVSNFETLIGREDIGSYHFQRADPPR